MAFLLRFLLVGIPSTIVYFIITKVSSLTDESFYLVTLVWILCIFFGAIWGLLSHYYYKIKKEINKRP